MATKDGDFTNKELSDSLDFLIIEKDVNLAGYDGLRPIDILPFRGRLIRRIRRSLYDGTFNPGPLRPIKMIQKNGKKRTALIGNTTDRIADRAVAVRLQRCDHLLHPSVHAYREGRGQKTVVAEIQTRMISQPFAVCLDLENAYPSVRADLNENALDRLRPNIGESVFRYLQNFHNAYRKHGLPIRRHIRANSSSSDNPFTALEIGSLFSLHETKSNIFVYSSSVVTDLIDFNAFAISIFDALLSIENPR